MLILIVPRPQRMHTLHEVGKNEGGGTQLTYENFSEMQERI